ncbi:hypothetical protein U9M48_014452 [Paspalum notatum var. saurae]|uniref:GEX2 N-terminal Ig-like domain-containing protein n=1 Tax=Paspalum notatum var. saurae TaxID=547442 RepID=A0AAQ3T4B5_PASNO
MHARPRSRDRHLYTNRPAVLRSSSLLRSSAISSGRATQHDAAMASSPAAIPRRATLPPLPPPSLCASLLVAMTSSSPLSSLAQQSPAPPAFMFGWLEDKSAFRAGDTAAIKVMTLDLQASASARASLSFSLVVNGKKGNSSFVSDVAANLGDDPNAWTITFVPLRAGSFVALVGEDRYSAAAGESYLPFTVAPADLHPSASRAAWTFRGRCVAGSRAFVSVAPRDAFGNAVARGADLPDYFRVSGSHANGSAVEFSDFHYNGWAPDGRIGVEFVPTVAGDLFVHVYGDNRELRDSPLMLTVKPGLLSIEKSTCEWKNGINGFQINSKLELFIYQRDSFGNTVPEIHPFDAQVVKRATNLSFPAVGLTMEAVADGVQLLSFNVVEPGEFVLTVFDPQLDRRVSNTAYMFDVFVAFCDGSNSYAYGAALAHARAGYISAFTVFLFDQYKNRSPVQAERLQVKILGKSGTSYVESISILPIPEPNETSNVEVSRFLVQYTPHTAGEYDIMVLCGNIVINGGNPYAMTALPGAIDISLSSVKFAPIVKMSVENEVVVRLVDKFMNPVVSLEADLRFHEPGENTTCFVAKEFVDNGDGSYIGHYVAPDYGQYSMCVLFEDKQLAPCPFEVQVFEADYFSYLKNDSVSVWEDGSVSFDVVSNDQISGTKAEITNSSSPLHGSVLQFNHIYRYTPFEGFFGNDSFSYTLTDAQNNVVTATVFIYVLCRPPQFISLPQKLHVTEDTIGPQFGGFPGIKMMYSDITENISVTVKARSGNVSLAPMTMKSQQPSVSVLGTGVELILKGTIEAMNDALQLLQYIGNQDFYGNDVIALYGVSRNGMEDAQFPIIVDPVNDPPVIIAPRSIFLGGKESWEGHQIFDKHRDQFQFSIVEPDLGSFPGNKSYFCLVLSLEVLEGTLTVTLPSSIAIATVAMKPEGVSHWKKAQDYVTIANHFILKGTAIRFHGNVQDCNHAMQQLRYKGQGASNQTILSITVNDLGHYGCYPDCSEMMSTPLSAAKTIRLVKKKHMDLRGSPLVGWLMAIEIMIMLWLGVILLYYLIKCIKALKDERRDRIDNERHTPEQSPSHLRMGASQSRSEDVGYCSAPACALPSGANRSSFRQRSFRSYKQEVELQPASGRNNGNQDDLPLTDKDK